MIDIRGILSCWSALFDSNKGQMELLQAVKRIVAEGKIFFVIWLARMLALCPNAKNIFKIMVWITM